MEISTKVAQAKVGRASSCQGVAVCNVQLPKGPKRCPKAQNATASPPCCPSRSTLITLWCPAGASPLQETEISITKAREIYRPVATRGSLFYFLIDSLNALDRVYHYSMANFVQILKKGMDLTPGGPDESQVGWWRVG